MTQSSTDGEPVETITEGPCPGTCSKCGTDGRLRIEYRLRVNRHMGARGRTDEGHGHSLAVHGL